MRPIIMIKSAALNRIVLVLLLCGALLFAAVPYVTFSAQTEDAEGLGLYHTYEEMVTEILDIQQNSPNIVQVKNLTTTYMGRTVWAVKISDSPQINDSTEPDVLFLAGQKANSHISVEIAMYLLNYLTSNYGMDESVTEHVNNREIWIVPMVNPDGHEYVTNETLNWVKNRRDNSGSFGVNLDRNYGHEWGLDDHTSDVPTSQNYRGTSSFSEPESRAIRNLVQSQDFVFSLSFSSSGEIITYPWGYSNSSTPQFELLQEISRDMGMYNNYNIMQANDLLETHGNLDDWLYEEGILPFTIMASDEDVPREEEIESIVEENLKPSLYLLDIADDPTKAQISQWTFMVYMGADNNLEPDGIRDFNEMEIEGSNPYFNIVVQFDRAPAYDATNGNWQDTRRFLVMKDYDTNIINSPLKEQLGEKNMADPQTLLDFVNWSQTNYPAEHYFLDIWGHGKGWQGVTLDGSEWLQMEDIKSVLPKFRERVDVAGFDNCNMAMIEVYATFLGQTDYIVGSEKEEDAFGWPYDRIFADLNEDPATSPLDLSKSIAFHYVDWAKNNSAYSASVSVVDMDHLSDIINRTSELAIELERVLPLFFEEIQYAADHAEQYRRPPNPRDLYHFAELIEQKVNNTRIKKAARHVIDGFAELISANERWTYIYEEPPTPVDHAHGITIWMYDGGSPSLFDIYQGLEFAVLSNWDEFLAAYKTAPAKPQVSFDTNYTLTDSDRDGNFDNVVIKYEAEMSGHNVIIEIFNNENQHITTIYQNDTQQGTQYSMDFLGFVPDYYYFYMYLENETGAIQNYSEIVDIWLGNERPDIVLTNMTLHRMDGNQVGEGLNKSAIDEELTEIRAFIENNGTNDLTDIKVEIYDGENLIKSETLDLKVGEEKSISVNWASKEGIRTIRTIVDPQNEIKETNETNNELKEIVSVKSKIPVEPLTLKGKIINQDNINIIGASVHIKNLRTNETINKTTNENGFSVELDPNWYNEGDELEVKGNYNSVSGTSSVFAYSDDGQAWVNITLKTELYDALFYFKLGLIIFEVIGFALVINYAVKLRKLKRNE